MKKSMLLYSFIFILLAVIMWQWVSTETAKATIGKQAMVESAYKRQLQTLSGIGDLASVHYHADVKVYVNGKSIDFSEHKYQLTNDYIHFEEGIGDVIHTHASGLAIGHMFNAVGMKLANNCLVVDKTQYCNDGKNTLKFYVNGKPNNEFQNYEIKDLDKYLISYGDESQSEIQEQLASITNLAPKYSADTE